MLDPKCFVVNARFLSRPASGVDRVAIELISALARRSDISMLTLLHPKVKTLYLGWLDQLDDAARAKIKLQPHGVFTGHFWEQIELIRAFPDMMLLSLCSTGPILRRNQAVMIHDAQVWDAASSFSRAFRIAYRVLLPTVARSARHVLTVSNFAKARLEDLGVVPRGKARVVLNGADHMLRIAADPDTLQRYELVAGGYLLAIGNLAPHKNLKLLIEAAAARAPGCPELIIAGGMNSKVFADAELTAGNGVRFIGRVSDAELKALYQGAMGLAFPSLTEGFGLPPVEAMQCGCPVIATTGGAVPEVCADAAIYVDPQDSAGWRIAMQRLASDGVLRQRLVELGGNRAARYRWSDAAGVIVKELE